MTDNNEDDMMRVYLDDDGVPAGVVNVKEVVRAGRRLAGDVALHGNDDAYVHAAMMAAVDAHGDAAMAVLQTAMAELAIAAHMSIDTYNAFGYPMEKQFQRLATGEPITDVGGWWDNARPSRAERRKKRR